MMEIKSYLRSYAVQEENDLQAAVARSASGARTFALIDDFFANTEEFATIQEGDRFALHASEDAKSFDRLGEVYRWLLEKGFRRDCVLLVVGGGVLQDVGCFVASTLMRGIRWIFIPTTLLAQCDSCIGSKSSINFGTFKNQLGTFYPPDQILLVESVLKTLPQDEIRSGMGEVIKLHLIHGGGNWQWLEGLIASRAVGEIPLREFVRSSLEIKKPFIEEDEFDKGRRNLLNYGHTFGHAYESVSEFAIPHGIAVTLGVLTATHFSAGMGLVEESHYTQLLKLLRPYFEPFQKIVRSLPLDQIVKVMKLDKKASGGRINCILTRGPGLMEKTSLESEQELRQRLSAFMETLS